MVYLDSSGNAVTGEREEQHDLSQTESNTLLAFAGSLVLMYKGQCNNKKKTFVIEQYPPGYYKKKRIHAHYISY